MIVTDDPAGYMNRVVCHGLPEQFYVSRLPYSEEYCSFIAEQQIAIGINLGAGCGYMPEEERTPHSQGEFLIELQEVNQLNEALCHRRLELIHTPTGTRRQFDHFYLDWCDFGTPSSEDFQALMNAYLSAVQRNGEPRVHLHCYGGHGRSGTFLLARALMVQPKKIVAGELLDELRAQRIHLVETQEPFNFAIEQAEKLSGVRHKAGHFKNPKKGKCVIL